MGHKQKHKHKNRAEGHPGPEASTGPALQHGPGSDHYYPSSQLDDLRLNGGLGKLDRKLYEKELGRLQEELVKMQYW